MILSLLYPDRDWRDKTYHEDHIFPKSEFSAGRLVERGYAPIVVGNYQQHYNTIVNLQLLTDKENLEKRAAPFDDWIRSRDEQFKARHTIPDLSTYDFDHFLDFVHARRTTIAKNLKKISM